MLEKWRKISNTNPPASVWLLIITFLCMLAVMALPIWSYKPTGFNTKPQKNLGIVTLKNIMNYPSTTDISYVGNRVYMQYSLNQPVRINSVGDFTVTKRLYQVINRNGYRQLNWYIDINNTSKLLQRFSKHQFVTKLNGQSYAVQIPNQISNEIKIASNNNAVIVLTSIIPVMGVEPQLVLNDSIYSNKTIFFN